MSKRTPSKRAAVLALAAAVAFALVGAFGLSRLVDHVFVAEIPNLSDITTPANAQVPQTTNSRSALSTGEMTTFVWKQQPEQVPVITFSDADGKQRTLADWKGRVVLLNLWATWCAPCRKEMPSLDRLQVELGSKDFEVVALGVDRLGLAGGKKFLEQTKVTRLALYVDATARAGNTLRAVGMPATLLIDREGREVGRLTGPAEWDSPEAKRLIEAVLKP